MKAITSFSVFIFLILSMVGCAHHNNVATVSEGLYQVSANDPKEAHRQANHYCGNLNGKLIYIDGNPNSAADVEKKLVDAQGSRTYKFNCERRKTLFDDIKILQ